MKTKFNAPKVLFLMILGLSLSLTAFSKNPDFSGKWALNKAESTMNADFSFAPLQLTIVQDGNTMTSERVSEWQGEKFTFSSSYTLDGKESLNEGFQGAEIVSIAEWAKKDKSLSIATTFEGMNGEEIHVLATYKKDGKQLIIDNKVTGGPGDGSSETWVYDKQ